MRSSEQKMDGRTGRYVRFVFCIRSGVSPHPALRATFPSRGRLLVCDIQRFPPGGSQTLPLGEGGPRSGGRGPVGAVTDRPHPLISRLRRQLPPWGKPNPPPWGGETTQWWERNPQPASPLPSWLCHATFPKGEGHWAPQRAGFIPAPAWASNTVPCSSRGRRPPPPECRCIRWRRRRCRPRGPGR